jgi:hypothetical protein
MAHLPSCDPSTHLVITEVQVPDQENSEALESVEAFGGKQTQPVIQA